MALYNYIISASCELKGVSFQKLVLPHDDIGHQLTKIRRIGFSFITLVSSKIVLATDTEFVLAA